MKATQKDQVELYKLIFTLNWEDPLSDEKALGIKSNDTIMTITSGGCNILGFLLFDPKEIYAVDINPSQSFLLELKISAIKNLDYKHFIEFLGLQPSTSRKQLYREVKGSLSEGAVNFWDYQQKIIEHGFLNRGRYESFVKYVGKLIKFIQGRKRVAGLFSSDSLSQQKQFYDEYWDIKRTRLIFNVFFNKYILAQKGLKADYFHFDDGSTSFSESFFKKFRKAARNIPINGNYFLHLYLNGQYRSVQEAPTYLQKENFDKIKERINRIKIITQDAKKYLMSVPEGSIDCYSLSNICELMSLDDTKALFNEVLRTSSPGGRICFRNLMIPREVPDSLIGKIRKNEQLTNDIFSMDRSFVYSKVAAYDVIK